MRAVWKDEGAKEGAGTSGTCLARKEPPALKDLAIIAVARTATQLTEERTADEVNKDMRGFEDFGKG